MRYKNVTDKILKFRAANAKGIKQVFELSPGKEMESDREVHCDGLENVSEKIRKSKNKGGD